MTCNPTCYAQPECEVCHRTKAPVGRSLPMVMTGAYCDRDCKGYLKPPFAGHLWPNEELPQ